MMCGALRRQREGALGQLVDGLGALAVRERVGRRVHDPHHQRRARRDVDARVAEREPHAGRRTGSPGTSPSSAETPRPQLELGLHPARRPSPARPPSPRPRARVPGEPGRAQRARVQQPQPGAAQQHVLERARLLAAGGERRLDDQVGQVGHDPLGQRRGRPRPSASRPRRRGRSGAARWSRTSSSSCGWPSSSPGRERHAQRDLGGPAGRLAALALHDPVDRALRHPAPGGQLAAGDRDHPRAGLVQLGLARDVDRLLRVAGGDQRPHARVRAAQVGGGERGGEELVDRVQQVLDVVLGGRDVVELVAARRSRRWCRSASAPATAARR